MIVEDPEAHKDLESHVTFNSMPEEAQAECEAEEVQAECEEDGSEFGGFSDSASDSGSEAGSTSTVQAGPKYSTCGDTELGPTRGEVWKRKMNIAANAVWDGDLTTMLDAHLLPTTDVNSLAFPRKLAEALTPLIPNKTAAELNTFLNAELDRHPGKSRITFRMVWKVQDDLDAAGVIPRQLTDVAPRTLVFR